MKRFDLIFSIIVSIMLLISCVILLHIAVMPQSGEPLLGDINSDGTINNEDIYYIKGHILRRWQLTKEEYFRADMNQDGNITSLDVVLIRIEIKENDK